MNIELFCDFFGWMTLVNLMIFVGSALMCITAKRLIQQIHGKLFDLTPEAINACLYGFLGIYKICLIIFNLVPWIALVCIRGII